jgi:hypothetical protein
VKARLFVAAAATALIGTAVPVLDPERLASKKLELNAVLTLFASKRLRYDSLQLIWRV